MPLTYTELDIDTAISSVRDIYQYLYTLEQSLKDAYSVTLDSKLNELLAADTEYPTLEQAVTDTKGVYEAALEAYNTAAKAESQKRNEHTKAAAKDFAVFEAGRDLEDASSLLRYLRQQLGEVRRVS